MVKIKQSSFFFKIKIIYSIIMALLGVLESVLWNSSACTSFKVYTAVRAKLH
jgi:hypothetical protein